MVDWTAVKEGVITFIVLFILAFLVYTAVKRQTLRDTWEEIKDLFTTAPTPVEEIGYYG